MKKALALLSLLLFTGSAQAMGLNDYSREIAGKQVKVSVQSSSESIRGSIVAYTIGTKVYTVDNDCSVSGDYLYCNGQKVAQIKTESYYFDDHTRTFKRLIPLNGNYVEIAHYNMYGSSELVVR